MIIVLIYYIIDWYENSLDQEVMPMFICATVCIPCSMSLQTRKKLEQQC